MSQGQPGLLIEYVTETVLDFVLDGALDLLGSVLYAFDGVAVAVQVASGHELAAELVDAVPGLEEQGDAAVRAGGSVGAGEDEGGAGRCGVRHVLLECAIWNDDRIY